MISNDRTMVGVGKPWKRSLMGVKGMKGRGSRERHERALDGVGDTAVAGFVD